MANILTRKSLLIAATLAAGVMVAADASANIVISEVDATGSSTAGYGADWFEITNTGGSAVDLTGWKMDDNSNSFSAAVPLTGVSSIAAGQSVVFVEDTGTTDAALNSKIKSTWFGSNVPAGFSIGDYGGTSVGLSSSGDAVNLFNSAGTLVTGVSFNASTSNVTFDNAAGLSGPISKLSSAGIDGAFVAPDGEIGSPGTIAPVPVPAAVWMLVSGLGLLPAFGRRRKHD